ncbi:DUF1269 domain-containing protein [Sedimentitalea arenosa]|uniref:DUF1269 domain-containing protein n=1 Tax=Sedimentitalea arenosa TaxID=2798803 RepID=A0A8J7IV73_9RHOB|nr:DUF1269 domain-containing protein [Arenibacterium arenosum]MBJ6371862.1 DUF1269 domain-containing protein [Arenibacterium arenosum]
MSDLFIVTFDRKDGAEALNAALAPLRAEQRLETQDTNIVTRDADGTVHLHHPVPVPLAQAIGGSVWGLVLGAVFLMPLAGAAVGAGVGALVGRDRDPGVDKAFLEQIGDTLRPGGSALCLWVRHVEEGALEAVLRDFGGGGTILRSPVSPELEERLQAMLDVAGSPD